MKYAKRIAGLEERQRAHDALPVKVKATFRRPGSLNGGGPTKSRKSR